MIEPSPQKAVAEDMSKTVSNDVLKRKARLGREEHQARVMSPARALRLSLARAADDLFDMALTVSGIHSEQLAQSGLLRALDDEMLLLVLDGPGGILGVASVDIQVLSGLIEMQTMGKVIATAADARLPTQTDAAMVAPLLDAVLLEFAENLSSDDQFKWTKGYRFGARIENARMMGLLLEAQDFHCFRIQVDMANGAKRGEIMLSIPVPEADVPMPGDKRGKRGVDKDAVYETLGQGAFQAAEAVLDVVLHRMSLPLSELGALKAGDVLNLPRESLSETRLEVGKEHPVGYCHLGQINGFRAVRLIPTGNRSGRRESGDGQRETAATNVGHMADGSGSMASDLSALSAAASNGLSSAPGPALSNQSDPLMDGVSDLPDLSDLPELAMGGSAG